jgi:TolA-binding protein
MMPLAALGLSVALAAGLWPFGADRPGKREATVGSLRPVTADVQAEAPRLDSSARAMAQYRRFLALDGSPPALRAEATRRLADLSLDAGVAAEADADDAGAGAAHFAEAITLYRSLLAGPAPLADRGQVLYQLARALEGAGQPDAALATLDQLVANHPDSTQLAEAQFRRGETWFVRQQYPRAESAYAAVIAAGPASDFYEQALYKHGWTLFKQGGHEEGLVSFLALLDRRLAAGGDDPAALLASMSRPERELLDDTLRVVSITFSYLDGADSIAAALADGPVRPWDYLLYRALGDQYLEKERFRDAAEAYHAYVARSPASLQAPVLQQAAIEAYSAGRFPTLVLEAKRQYVAAYGLDAPFWQGRNPRGPLAAGETLVVAQLKAHLGDLAAHDHATAQQSRLPADYARAADGYRRYLAYFPEDPGSAQRAFLLGELLFESQQFAEARDAYLRAAYDYGEHENAAEAGYAVVLASREAEKRLDGAARTEWHATQVEHALRFAATFPAHPQAAAVLTTVAEESFAAGQLERAAEVAGLVLTLQPPAAPALERVAWTVLAHARFDLGRYAEAEQAYLRLRGLDVPEQQRGEVEQRIAASIYRQAEAAQEAGDVDRAVSDYLRIADATPDAGIRPTALFDAATLLLNQKRWKESAGLLQRFRREFPAHEFNTDVTAKLAYALDEGGQPAEAGAEYERIASMADTGDEARRAALWRAAELYAGAGLATAEARVYETVVRQHPAPFDAALEARHRRAGLAAKAGDWATRSSWLQDIITADATAGAARNDRSRLLAASAAIELARPLRDACYAVRLRAPLAESLKLKTSRMELALAAYGRAAQYGIASVSTAATFETAELYYQLSRDLLASERPRGLNSDELEQYDLLLEEQAFPFEEKAIDLYRVNAGRIGDGIYDEWVRASFARLAVIAPARYAREERSEDVATWMD